MAEVSFDTTAEEACTIDEIADRAFELAQSMGYTYSPMTLGMDVTACHANGTPLNLAALLAADDGDFGHDVFGINRHIDRTTGILGDCFVPRYAACYAG